MVEGNVRDRYIGLVVFGIAEILIGMICAGLALLAASRAEMAVRYGIAGAGAAVAPALAVYGIAAIGFVSLGAGSLRARRWARTLSVAVSAVWLAGGIVATVMLLIILPRLTRTLPAADAAPATGAAIITAVVALILIPLGLLLFYGNADVRLTCERRDEIRRWTDRVPVAVLAVILVTSVGAVAMVASMGNPVLPVMGIVMTGPPAALAFLSLAMLSAWIALQLYRLKESAWWTLVLLHVAGVIVGMFSLMRSPGAGGVSNRDPLMVALLIGTWLVYFAFLLYLRRYFIVSIRPRTRRDD